MSFHDLPKLEQDRLLAKLAKLKALSECKTGNVNETATAAAAMSRLMMEYQIEVADLMADQPQELSAGVEDSGLGATRNGFPLWQSGLLNALAHVNHCLCFTERHEFVPSYYERKPLSSLRLAGTPDDIANTRRLFMFCLNEIERLVRRWQPRAAVALKNDFRSGAARGIGDKVRAEHEAVLAEERARTTAQGKHSNALTLFDRKLALLDDKAAELGLVTRTARKRYVEPGAYQAGYAAGRNLDMEGKQRPALR